MSTDNDEPIDLAPFNALTQKQQWSHLTRFHKVWHGNRRLDSKSRKAEYEQWHNEQHLKGDVDTPHTHTAVAALAPPPADPTSGADLANVDLSKPLNVTQRRALRDLVENDFLAMRAEIEQMAHDMAREKRTQITAEWSARGSDAQAYEDRGQALMDGYRTGAAALIAEASAAGVDLKLPKIKDSYPSLEATVPGLQEALRAAEQEVDADKRRALNTLERSRLTAQRKVLLTGVTQEALQVLDTIPTASELMLRAAADRSKTAALT